MKKQTLMAAMAGAALLTTLQAQAQITYNNGDLLLNFRNTTIAPGTGPDVVVDLGTIANFSGLTGVTDLGNGSLYNAGDLVTAFGSGNMANVGFSVAGSTKGVSGYTPATAYFVSINEASSSTYNSSSAYPLSTSTYSSTRETDFSTAINNVGDGAAGLDGSAFLSPLGTSPTATAVKEGSSAFDYDKLASVSPSTAITYNSGATAGSMESAQYAALWDVPQSGTGAAELGYFTFNDTTGDITYTSDISSAVPEPSTYGLIAGIGLLALAFRRQLRSVIA
jgi:hypothetical protein